jgi:transposase
MDSMVMGPEDGRRRRRSHSAQFKAESVAACQQSGVSIAAVALSRSLNANLLRSWVVAAERREASGERAAVESGAAVEPAAFLPVPLSCAANTGALIRIEIRRGSTQVTVQWPISVASECGQWLRELLR